MINLRIVLNVMLEHFR
jgi:hypothetical protein